VTARGGTGAAKRGAGAAERGYETLRAVERSAFIQCGPRTIGSSGSPFSDGTRRRLAPAFKAGYALRAQLE